MLAQGTLLSTARVAKLEVWKWTRQQFNRLKQRLQCLPYSNASAKRITHIGQCAYWKAVDVFRKLAYDLDFAFYGSIHPEGRVCRNGGKQGNGSAVHCGTRPVDSETERLSFLTKVHQRAADTQRRRLGLGLGGFAI